MKRLLVCAALFLGCVPADSASLRLRGTIGPPDPPASPVLNNVAVNVGEYTRSGGGGVRLSSMDDTTTYAVPVYGLGLQDPDGTACATWTVTRVSGTANHFNMVSAQVEGTSAITPTPTSTGVTAHLNGGPYVFNVNCTDANGNASNTATLTYNIIDDAANMDEFIGNFPAVTSGYASFASSAGYKLLIPTGFKKLTAASWSIVCPNECTLTWADITKPGLFQSFNPNANQQTNLRVKDITFTGNATANAMLFAGPTGGGTHNGTLALENVGCKFKLAEVASSPVACFDTKWPAASGDSITDFNADGVGLGIRIQANGYTLKRVYIKNYFINAMDVNVADDLTMQDWLFWNPQVAVGGYHGDCWQITNGSSNKNWNIQRGGCVTAGGYGPTQGPIFPGHSTRARGYISNGSGGAGLNVTLTGTVHDPNAFFDEGVDRSQIIAPGCITAAENARVASSATSGTAVLTGISARLCGSAGSPIDIYTYTMENVAARGIFHTGYGYSGWGQNSAHGTGGIQNFAFVHQTPQPTYATYGVGTIVGNQLTIVGPTTSSATDANATYNAGINYGSSEPYGISYSGLTGGSLYATAKTANGSSQYCNKSTDVTCVYTLNRSPGNVSSVAMTFVPPVGTTAATAAPQISFGETATADLYTGTGQTVKNGYSSAGCLFPLGGGSYGSPPANMTLENCWNYTTAPPDVNFDKGDPGLAFEAISIADWNAMTPTQVLATHCSYMLGQAGGLLDNGDGTWASPFKPDSDADGDAEWWDGTDIDGCS